MAEQHFIALAHRPHDSLRASAVGSQRDMGVDERLHGPDVPAGFLAALSAVRVNALPARTVKANRLRVRRRAAKRLAVLDGQFAPALARGEHRGGDLANEV